jgi:hypothetical protein
MTRSPGGHTSPSSTIFASWLLRVGLPLAAIAMTCAGCEALAAPFMAQVPHTDGRWSGRIVPVEVRDQRGEHVYMAAALDLTGGTGFDRMKAAAAPGSRVRTPLLATEDSGIRIIDPAKLPVGREVTVAGAMSLRRVNKQRDAPPSGDAAVSRAFPNEKAGGEYVIVLRGEPKVIGD